MATTIVTKNSSTAAAVPTAAQLVQGELAVNVADKRLYTEDNGGAIVELGTNPSAEIVANGGIALPDNGKATFGASDDLQIYHDGFNTLIKESGAGSLLIDATNTYFRNAAGTKDYAWMVDGGAVSLFHNNAAKLATTSTGIDVTGTATMDGLVVENNTSDVKGTVKNTLTAGTRTATLDILPQNDGAYGVSIQASGGSGTGTFQFNNKNIMKFDLNNDISFYEDTGTTAKLFWDASAEELEIGTSTDKLELGDSYYRFRKGNQNKILVGNTASALGSGTGLINYLYDAEPFIWWQGTERMRIDSAGNVGIGTSSPASTLEIAKNDQTNGATLSITNSFDGGDWNAGDTVGSIDFRIDDGSSTEKVRGQIKVFDDSASGSTYPFANAMSFSTGYFATLNERMRIDSAGNVGIGVVPKTGGSTWQHVQFGGTGNLIARKDDSIVDAMFSNNYYVNASNVDSYITTGAAARMFMNDNVISFDQAASGSTDAAIGWSERMRIDSAGNVGIGTTSPAQTLHAESSASGASKIVSALVNPNSGVVGTGAQLWLSGSNATTRGTYIEGQVRGTGNKHDLIFATSADASSPAERMRIDSAGNLLVGKTATGTGTVGAELRANGFNAFVRSGGEVMNINRLSSDGTIIDFRKDSSTVGSISVTASTTSYNTSSDQRLKENIADADDAGSKIDAIQVRKYDWKADGSHQDYGMIAQELQLVAPEAVSGDADSENMMGVDYSKLVPMLIKEIQSLRNRVAQLETGE